MTKRLNWQQVVITLTLLLLIGGGALYFFFNAPAFPEPKSPLAAVAIVSVTSQHREVEVTVAPRPTASPTPAPTPTPRGIGPAFFAPQAIGPPPEVELPANDDPLATLKAVGVPTGEQSGLKPVKVTIQYWLDGRPRWRWDDDSKSYRLEGRLQWQLFIDTLSATEPLARSGDPISLTEYLKDGKLAVDTKALEKEARQHALASLVAYWRAGNKSQ